MAMARLRHAGRLDSEWASVDGYRIHARSGGSDGNGRPPVVLVHGIGVSSRYMIPTAVELADRYRVYAPDLPGFGKSDKPAVALNVPQLADALAAWIAAMRLEPATVVGNSFGCQVVADLAANHPRCASRAVLIGPTVDPTARTAVQQLGRWMKDNPREPPSLGAVVLRDYADCGMARVAATFRASLQDRIEVKLPAIGTPALVIRGTRDPIVPQEWAERATSLLAHGRLALVPGSPHAANYAAPLEVSRIVGGFIEDG